MAKRRYRLGKRAEQQAQTRDRIVEAIMTLHEEVGPRETTISAIAERAGVERLTVYRHFPDEASLYGACSARFAELNPPPEPRAWSGEADPRARTRAALVAIYAYYQRNARMLDQLYRDKALIPALEEAMSQFEQYLEAVAEDLLMTWDPPPSRRPTLKAVLGHALCFATWRSLTSLGLGDDQVAEMMTVLGAHETHGD